MLQALSLGKQIYFRTVFFVFAKMYHAITLNFQILLASYNKIFQNVIFLTFAGLTTSKLELFQSVLFMKFQNLKYFQDSRGRYISLLFIILQTNRTILIMLNQYYCTVHVPIFLWAWARKHFWQYMQVENLWGCKKCEILFCGEFSHT